VLYNEETDSNLIDFRGRFNKERRHSDSVHPLVRLPVSTTRGPAQETHEGKTAPDKYNVAPDVTRRGGRGGGGCPHNLDNLITFYLYSLLYVSYLCVCTIGRYTQKINKYNL